MADTWFVTGTDTGVGKTLVSVALLHAARAHGLRTIGLKPIAAGAEWHAGALRNSDACALQAAATEALPYETVNPVVLEPPIAPHLAAAVAGLELHAELLARHCHEALRTPHDFALIEGAGGWRVPLNATQTLADLAIALRLPVVLVVGMRLGCINHALLSAEAIRRDGLVLAGWVANQVDPGMPRCAENLLSLDQRLQAPRLGFIPWQPGGNAEQIASRLDLSRLRGR
jgi:dethiobiotin synthetase